LVFTAAHLTTNWSGDAAISVRIAGTSLPATLVKQGEFEDVDLTLFSVDEQKLPKSVLRIHTPLCQGPPWPGDPVIVVDQAAATRSHIISPQILPFTFRNKFHTLIADVASTGNSGSGVFNPNQKCVLGIMSRKIVTDGKDIAKYFVPASEIRNFIPIELREQAPE
jgi:Trypsin-like peptidase domain